MEIDEVKSAFRKLAEMTPSKEEEVKLKTSTIMEIFRPLQEKDYKVDPIKEDPLTLWGKMLKNMKTYYFVMGTCKMCEACRKTSGQFTEIWNWRKNRKMKQEREKSEEEQKQQSHWANRRRIFHAVEQPLREIKYSLA